MRHIIYYLLILILTFIPYNASAMNPRIIGPEWEIRDNDIIVNVSIEDVQEFKDIIMTGIAKEIIFTIELLRQIRFWPDEFVVSKKIKRVIRYDNLRDQFLAISDDGINTEERHFRNFDSMQRWLFDIRGVDLANIRELYPGRYYLRVVVKSRSLEHLPLVGFLMHFVPEVDMSLSKKSSVFKIGLER